MWRTVIATVFIFVGVLVYGALPHISYSTVQIRDHTIRVDIADTSESRAIGLGGRESLSKGEGMLFVFPDDGVYSFWMKDMVFAIDILWISSEGEIVDLKENISPDTYPASFMPRSAARYVLELPAGTVEEYGLELGDIVRL